MNSVTLSVCHCRCSFVDVLPWLGTFLESWSYLSTDLDVYTIYNTPPKTNITPSSFVPICQFVPFQNQKNTSLVFQALLFVCFCWLLFVARKKNTKLHDEVRGSSNQQKNDSFLRHGNQWLQMGSQSNLFPFHENHGCENTDAHWAINNQRVV